MHVLHGYDHVPANLRGGVLAIGNFDGVHRGHQALLEVTRTTGMRVGALSGVILFEPHPRMLFQPDRVHFVLTPLRQKLALLEAFSLDLAIVLAFDHSLANLTAQAFMERVLVAGLGVRHLVIGYDFRFGKNRGGDPELLQSAGVEMGFQVTVVAQVGQAGEVFSSSAIRAELAQGDVHGAAEMLGHWWRVVGTVLGGAKRGTALGFPTANIRLNRGTTLAHGIYAVRVHVHGVRYHGAAYLGTRPTFDSGASLLEVFLFDFEDDLYGREIEVEFISFLRPDRRFDSVDALKAQMQRDCIAVREILAQISRDDPMRAYPIGRVLADGTPT
jgi:riboflavin kinase/FMN adenylyltransferase